MKRLVEIYQPFIFVRKLGVGICFIVSEGSELIIEDGAKVIVKESISKINEELKLKLEIK